MAGKTVLYTMEEKLIIDLHVHTSSTPGVSYTLRDLLQSAKTNGLDGLCITDVHTLAGGLEAKHIAEKENLLILVGFEAYTDRGHFLAILPSPENLPEISTWIQFDPDGQILFSSLVEAVSRYQGVLIAAHPFDRSVHPSPGDGLIQLKGVSAIEVLNANRPALVNEFAEEIATGIGLPGIGGSDSREDLKSLGRFATLVLGDVNNESDLIERILSHDVWPIAIGDPAFDMSEDRDARHDQNRRRHSHNNQHATNRKSRAASGSNKTSRSGPSRPRFHQTESNSEARSKENRFSQKHKSRRSPRNPPPKPKP